MHLSLSITVCNRSERLHHQLQICYSTSLLFNAEKYLVNVAEQIALTNVSQTVLTAPSTVFIPYYETVYDTNVLANVIFGDI